MTPALVLSKNIFYRNRESEHIFNLEDCVRIIISWSEWRDSNSRHPGPKPGALPTGPHPDMQLKNNSRSGQICGQGNSTTVLPNFQRKQSRVIAKIKGSKQHFGKSNRFGIPAPKSSALPTGPHPGFVRRPHREQGVLYTMPFKKAIIKSQSRQGKYRCVTAVFIFLNIQKW